MTPPSLPERPRDASRAWLLTVEETARVLAVSKRSVWSLLATGRLHAVRFGRRTTRIDARDVERFIEAATSRRDP